VDTVQGQQLPDVRREPVTPVVVVVLTAAVVTLLGIGVRVAWGPQMRLDTAVSRVLYVGDVRPHWVDVLLQTLTSPGLTVVRVVVFAPVVVWLLTRRLWRTAAWVAAAVLTIGLLNTGLKEIIGRLRPQFAGGGAGLHSLSYPSGHSSGIACLVTVALVLAWPVLGHRGRTVALVVGIVLALEVAVTRMALGVHYLSDVVGGLCLGVGWTLLLAVLTGALAGGRAALPARAEREAQQERAAREVEEQRAARSEPT
jgi:undecaprenyl-diphosphatase